MSDKQYDLLVFIGRFQPFHCGHKVVVDKALELANNVLVLIGGENQPRTVRNPWTFEERRKMVELVYPDVSRLDTGNLRIKPLNDHTYNDDAWVKQVQERIDETETEIWGEKNQGWNDYGVGSDRKIGLIGCDKDGTSYYLKLFPHLLNEGVEFLNPINATDIRNRMFVGNEWSIHQAADNVLPLAIARTLLDHEREPFMPHDAWAELVEEFDFLAHYRQERGNGPFLTADTLVECGGHILVIERGGEYGKGTIALPGGFVEPDETFMQGAIRELREETKLKVPEPVLKGSIVATETFDQPHRDERARIVTVCHHIKLQNELSLPKIKGSDDAAKAFWLPISEIESTPFFTDHGFIIRKLLGV